MVAILGVDWKGNQPIEYARADSELAGSYLLDAKIV
jgi:hypothetical protein